MDKIDILLNYAINNEWAIDYNWGITQFNRTLLGLSLNRSQSSTIKEPTITYHSNAMSSNDLSKFSNNKELIIAEITLKGVMMTETQPCGEEGIRDLSDTLYNLYQNAKISGILMNVNSGGGESLAGDMLYSTLQDRNKPIVSHIYLMGSAALQAGVATDLLVSALPSTLIGSIGSYLSIDKGLVDVFKDKVDTIYATQSTNKNKEFRSYLNGDNSLFQKYVDRNAEFFINTVKNNRPLSTKTEDLEKIFSGELFTSKVAKKLGLIDFIGSKLTAVEKLKRLIK